MHPSVLVAIALAAASPGEAGTMPPPLPPPAVADAPVLPAPADPLELLWNHRLQFDAAGAPLVTIRIAEGRREIAFRPRGAARLVARGGAAVDVPAFAPLRVRAVDALPAALVHHVLLGELEHADRAGVAAARQAWEARGVEVVTRAVGGVYGVAGKVVDNRRVLLLAHPGSEPEARAAAERLRERHGLRPALFAEIVTPPSGRLEVLDAAGARVAIGDRVVSLEVDGGAGFTVDRGGRPASYRGRLHVTIDATGRLAAVDALPLEELLRGLVPSEIPPGSPPEALKAQAVTARSNVLAQIGTRHLTDPYVLCDEVHCQAFHGEGAETAATDAAVAATAGEAIFDSGGALVDGVYSAMCGGHGEDNDAVWSNLPSPSLRGRHDLRAEDGARWQRQLASEQRLRAFLRSAPPAYCSVGARSRYRWERRLSPAELQRLVAPLGVGDVRALRVLRRGVSGRALALEVVGSSRSAAVHGELRIRRLLGDLHSAMFVVDRDGGDWVLRGGGWGHGAGMCQWGAIGRARSGQAYREILRAYFAGAEVARVY